MHLSALQQAQAALAGGRLAEAASLLRAAADQLEQEAQRQAANSETAASSAKSFAAIPAQFTLHVDGIGSFRVLRAPQVSIGPAGGTTDLQLQADASLRAIQIRRIDEDYLLTAPPGVKVNDEAADEHLLTDGDRIVLSSRCRLLFRRPSVASATALIQLGSMRLPKGDVRCAILMAREIIISPGPHAHIRCDEMPDQVALIVRNDQLYCQASGVIVVGQVESVDRAQVALGQHVTVGGLGFVATAE